MNLLQAMFDMDDRFVSGNSIPVERATISREQWKVIREVLAQQVAVRIAGTDIVDRATATEAQMAATQIRW